MFVPLSCISFTFFIFRADLLIFFRESLSEIISALERLFFIKNLLNSLVFFISFFTSSRMCKVLSKFFFDNV